MLFSDKICTAIPVASMSMEAKSMCVAALWTDSIESLPSLKDTAAICVQFEPIFF